MLVARVQYRFDRLPESMQARYTLVRDEWGVQFYMAEAVDSADALANSEE